MAPRSSCGRIATARRSHGERANTARGTTLQATSSVQPFLPSSDANVRWPAKIPPPHRWQAIGFVGLRGVTCWGEGPAAAASAAEDEREGTIPDFPHHDTYKDCRSRMRAFAPRSSKTPWARLRLNYVRDPAMYWRHGKPPAWGPLPASGGGLFRPTRELVSAGSAWADCSLRGRGGPKAHDQRRPQTVQAQPNRACRIRAVSGQKA